MAMKIVNLVGLRETAGICFLSTNRVLDDILTVEDFLREVNKVFYRFPESRTLYWPKNPIDVMFVLYR